MKTKTSQYIIFLTTTFFVLGGLYLTASASGYAFGFYNHDRESITLNQSISGGIAKYGQTIGTGLSGTIATTTVYIEVGGGAGPTSMAVTIECYTDADYTTYSSGCSTQSTSRSIAASTVKTLYSFNTVLDLQSSNYYRVGLGCTANCAGGTNPDATTYGTKFINWVWPFGVFGEKTAPLEEDFPTFGIADMYFDVTSASSFGLTGSLLFENVQATSTLPFNFPVLASCTNADSASSTWGSTIVDYTLCGLFQPRQTSLGFLFNAYSTMKQTFPFSMFFNITDALQTGIDSAEADSAVETDWVITFPAFGNATSSSSTTIPIITSGGLISDLTTDEFQNTVYNWILLIYGLEIIYLAYSLVLHHKNT